MRDTLAEWAFARRSSGFRIGFVATAFVVSLTVRIMLDGDLPPGFPYLTFFPAVILTTFFAGVRAGVILALLCGVASWYFFIPPFNSFGLTANTGLALVFYAFIVLTDIGLIYVMNQALVDLGRERQRSEELALSRSAMFQELQHRVSNNLQVVSSLLTMQRRGIRDVEARRALEIAAQRLSTVSSIQRRLNDPAHQQVDFARFLKEIVPDVLAAAGADGKVVSAVEAEPVAITSDQAVPLALICTELVANAVEHGRRDGAPVTIRVTLRRLNPDLARLEVHDDGPGLPAGFDLAQDRSLGLRIVRQFAEQLGGVLSLQTDGGTVGRLDFPLEEEAEKGPRLPHAAVLPATRPEGAAEI